MIKRAIYSILLILITSLKVMGTPYCDVRKFSIIDGLAANTFSGIAQTPDRLMWFSTWNGISYYDGNSFHTFRDEADDIDLLSTNRFMDIYATSKNNVWCITADRQPYIYETRLCTFIPVGDNIKKLYNIDLRVDKIYSIEQSINDFPVRRLSDTYQPKPWASYAHPLGIGSPTIGHMVSRRIHFLCLFGKK
jgi:hypothetical protein